MIGSIVGISGRVTPTADSPALFVGAVSAVPADYDEGDYVEEGFFGSVPGAVVLFTGAVSRDEVDSYEGPSLFYGIRVVLNGVEIPEEDLAGVVTVQQSLDTHVVTFSFGLVGRQYSILSTVQTWTLTPVELWLQQGPAGGVRDTLRMRGYVRTCRQESDVEPVVSVECADNSILFNEIVTCLEVEPFSGLSRGDYVRELCADAGITVDVPDGAAYDRPFSSTNQRLFEVLAALGEPQGWYWRFRDDGTMEAYRAELKTRPVPADHEWGPDDIESIQIDPPSGVPSRWLVRGFSTLVTDELGLSSAITTTVTEGLYAVKIAVQEQATDGTITDVASPLTPTVQTVSVVRDVQSKRGDKLIRQQTEEQGWYNLAAAKLRTPNFAEGAGPVDIGYYYCQAYIDEAGDYRGTPSEAWGTVSLYVQDLTYRTDGALESVRSKEYGIYRKSQGVRSQASATLDVIGSCVGSDGQSYYSPSGTAPALRVIEQYGLLREGLLTPNYSSTGRTDSQQQRTWSFYAPATFADPGEVGYLLYDGSAQQPLVATYVLTELLTRRNLYVDDDVVAGRVDRSEGYTGRREVFGLVKQVSTQYNIISSDAYEEVVHDENGTSAPRIITGRPVAQYISSPWLEMKQAPLEWSLDDPTAELWFGPKKEVISSQYILDLTEAQALVERRRRRALADTIVIKRHEANARPGQTVLVTWPDANLRHRCLLVSLQQTRDIATAEASAEYTLERYR